MRDRLGCATSKRWLVAKSNASAARGGFSRFDDEGADGEKWLVCVVVVGAAACTLRAMTPAAVPPSSCSSFEPVRDGPRSWLRWVYPCSLAVMVVVASGRSQVAAPDVVNIDKLIHFSVFGLLATLVVRAPGMRGAWKAVLLVSLFGISDEIRQSFTPGRSVEFADWLADTAGAAVAVVAYTFWPWYRRLLEIPLGRKRSLRVVTTEPVSESCSTTSTFPVA